MTADKRRWKEPSVLIGVIGVVIAVFALGRDLFGFEIPPHSGRSLSPAKTASPGPPSPGPPSQIPPSQVPPSQGPASAPAVARSGEPLINLSPLAGGSFLSRVPGTAAFAISCASNRDGDRYHAVQFAIPRRNATTFSSVVDPAGIVDDVRVDIRVDRLVRTSLTLRPDQRSSALAAGITGGSTLEIRLSCSRPGGSVTFDRAVLMN